MIAGASGTNRPSKAGSANRAGSGHGGSGESPDVRGHRASNQNAPENDDRSDAQIGLLFSALLRDSRPIIKSRTMTRQAEHSGIRIAADNPNHHLWNNHGTWFLHYTVHPTPFTKDRIRRSLGTKDLAIARARRDAFLAQVAGKQDAA
jgi:hypothetical protein